MNSKAGSVTDEWSPRVVGTGLGRGSNKLGWVVESPGKSIEAQESVHFKKRIFKNVIYICGFKKIRRYFK